MSTAPARQESDRRDGLPARRTGGRRPEGTFAEQGVTSRLGGPLVLILLLAAAACSIPRWPVAGPVSSDYGIRFQGVLPEIHRGVDVVVPTGSEVRAMATGRVRFAGTMQGYGRVVWLDHGGEVLSVYAHLSEILVTAGDVVNGRSPVGLSGMSGSATAPHLHFEIWRWGRPSDPVPLLGGFPR